MIPVETNQIVKKLKAEGWQLESSKGSHFKYRHPETGKSIVVVADKKKDVPIGTARKIAKAAGWI